MEKKTILNPLNLTPEQIKQYEQLDHTKNDCALNALFVHLPKATQEQLGDTKGMRKACADRMNEQPKLYNDLFKYQEKLRQLDPTEVPRVGWVSEWFNKEYRSIRQEIALLEVNNHLTPEQNKKLDTLKARKKALEEEGNKQDDTFVRAFIRFGTGTGVCLSSMPLVGLVGATAAGIGASSLLHGNEFETVKQALLLGAAGKVVGKLRKIAIINQTEGKLVGWISNLNKQGGVNNQLKTGVEKLKGKSFINGAQRAAEYGKSWNNASIKNAIEKFRLELRV
ncbi:hypothetical protein [Cardinium endosymbiont of Nabis limbatus]|uniref:hypothetical protein n=1 Tax=Cardinium endosymbiont of Nabis limbatus TaxID=3066217 RepID=UPI003AF381BE